MLLAAFQMAGVVIAVPALAEVSPPTGTYCGTINNSSRSHVHFLSISSVDIHIDLPGRAASLQCDAAAFIMQSKVQQPPCPEECPRPTAVQGGNLQELIFENSHCGGAGLTLVYDPIANSIILSDVLSDKSARLTQQDCHSAHWTLRPPARYAAIGQPTDPTPITLPKLHIDSKSVITAGVSHAGDFASQFHIAWSSLVSASCVFSGQPFHCAVHKFARDFLVPQNPATGVPNCDGCPPNMTLLYDHCKNHPQYVDVGELVDYPRRACGQNPITKKDCIDDVKNLYTARSYLFHPTHDRCYLPGSVENTMELYGMLMTDPANQIKFVDDQPFPHTLPKNSTPYFNHSEPAGFDGPGECLRWVFNPKFGYGDFQYAVPYNPENHFYFDQSEFVDSEAWGAGLQNISEVYIPTQCQMKGDSLPAEPCKLLFMLGMDTDFAAYGESNGIVIVALKLGGPVDRTRFPNACEVQRGLSDVYGQLGTDYAMQSGFQMRVGGRIIKRLMGLD